MKLKTREEKVFACIAIIAIIMTIFRFWLAVRTPLYLQADAGYDDFLSVKYAVNMLQGNWLGAYDWVALAKTASFSMLLAFGYICGIPYSFGLIVSYTLASLLMTVAVNKIIKNYYFGFLMYLFLLFSPVMFHEENIQKVYRGGYIVVFSMLVIAAYIGILHEVKKDKKSKIVLWTIVGAVALPIFWFLKEDSIWIIPFIALSILYSVIIIIKAKSFDHKIKIIRSILIVFPLISLIVCTNIYKQLNYTYYGIDTITDRSGSNYKKVISDLLKIEDPESDVTWITKDMLNKAAECSPTLNSIMPQLTARINSWYGDEETTGDIIIWIFREAVDDAGIYAQGSEAVETFYGNIDAELQEAFCNGSLVENNDRIYLSSVSRGYTLEEFWKNFKGRIKEVIGTMVTYSQNMTTVSNARGEYEKIAIMAQLTNSEFTWKDTESYLDKMSAEVVSVDLGIVQLYQVTGTIFFIFGSIGVLILIIHTLIEMKRKQFEHIEITIVVISLAASCFALIIGVIWFANFLSIKKVYDYLCGAIPIMNVLEAIGMYVLIKWFINILIKQVRIKQNNRNNMQAGDAFFDENLSL